MQDGRQQLVDLRALALSEGEDLHSGADAGKVFGVVPTVAHDSSTLETEEIGQRLNRLVNFGETRNVHLPTVWLCDYHV